MARMYFDEQGKAYRIQFRYARKQYHKSLKTDKEKVANSMRATIEETLFDLERGRVEMPTDADPWEFIKTGGKRTENLSTVKVVTLADLWKWYFDNQTEGSKEPKTIETEKLHQSHFLELIGSSKDINGIIGADLQTYINKRARQKWQGRTISAQTIQKEIKTLQMVWNRAFRLGIVKGQAPTIGLDYPKSKQKIPFQTWEEIVRNVARGGLTPKDVKEQWDSLFLSMVQVNELIEFCRTLKTKALYFFPVIVFAAHTGARLSEILRSRVEDFRFDENRVIIREKKKKQSEETHRQVTMSPLLRNTMQTYFKTIHPGGAFAICVKQGVQMETDTLQECRKWIFRKSKWKVLRGFHVLRHSFASNMARQGIEQSTIDKLMGHQTDAMSKRYRHLFPQQMNDAITKLFG